MVVGTWMARVCRTAHLQVLEAHILSRAHLTHPGFCRQIQYLCIQSHGKPCGSSPAFFLNQLKSELNSLQECNSLSIQGVETCYSKITEPSFRRFRAGYAIHTTFPQRNEFYWTKLISEYTKSGQGKVALKIYKQMLAEGVIPKTYTFVAALKACSSVAELEVGKEIHAHVIERGDESDIFVASTLVDMYAKCGNIVDARQVFENMPYRNVVSWNAIIMAYAQEAAGDSALQLYARMQQDGFTPDAHTFVAVLKACTSLVAREEGKPVDAEFVKRGRLEKGRAIHCHVVRSGLESNTFVANTLIGMYAKCGSMVDACMVFERMPQRDVVSWNVMIMGYAEGEMEELALQLFELMQHGGVAPDSRTFVAVLKACVSLAGQEKGKQVDGELIKMECLEKGRVIHSQIAKCGFESDIFVASTLVDMYVKCGSMVDARWVFEKMPYRNVVSWTIMIMGYAQMEKGKLALQLFERMQHEGLIPNNYTYVAALMASGSLVSLEIGKKLHAEICRVRLEDDAFVATGLIDMYSKCGSMVDAQLLFDALPVKDVAKWSALIAGYSHQGDTRCVFELFERMQQAGLRPIAMICLSVLAVCSHAGLVEKAQEYFHAMCSDYEIIPSDEHFHCMVNLLGRAGQLDEAMEMVKKMQFEPNIATWITLLGACQKWNYVEIGRCAFEVAVTLDEKQAEAYALMTNIYASAHMWEECAKIQTMRRNA